MNIFNYAVKDCADILEEMKVNPARGLGKKDIATRVKKFGLNKLTLKQITGWHIFFRQFKSAFIYLLLLAMVITVFLGEMIDAIMIFIFLVINTFLGFFQEYRSEKTVQLLNKYTVPKAKVLRYGKIAQIAASELVPGDIIILETGDKVPADARLLEQHNLIINETVLTGESIPVFKKTQTLPTTPLAYHQAENLVFGGTYVLKGVAKALVLATGQQTAFGKIAKLTSESSKISDFEKSITRFSRFILKLVGMTLLIIFTAHVLIKQGKVDIFELIVFSVALTVSVIPEALPLVTTFSLARGAKRMATKKVIVKRLSALEDLGGIEILCSDKTGTLTENCLKIANTYSASDSQTMWLANLASSFELKKQTEPFDLALIKGLTAEQRKRLHKVIKLAEESFDPTTRKNSVMVKDGHKTRLIVRGAPETVIAMCTQLSQNEKKNIATWISREGKQGYRVLAIAHKQLADDTKKKNFDFSKNDKLFFSGIISFVDPIKETSFNAVKKAKHLGVKLMILTGDSVEVAGAVASEIGLIDSSKQVISGEKWQKAKLAQKEQYLRDYVVFARVSPEEKFDIIQNLRQKYMVGFLGEGINDAPALKIAGVSLVVDSAADIAREASDIILLKKNLSVIIDGIQEGRQVFTNTNKYIKSTLASNFGNFFAIATTSLLIDFLPMLPIQILLLNLLSDTPMISISTDNVDQEELKSPRKYEARDIIFIAIFLGMVSTVFDFIFFALFYHTSPAVLQTNWFIGSVLTEIALVFSIRTKSFFMKSCCPSRSLIGLSVVTLITTVILPFTTFGQKVFQFTPPTFQHLLLILAVVIVYFIFSETVKLLYYKNFYNKKYQTLTQ